MADRDILLGPLVPCTPETRLLGWNDGQVLPGFVRVSDIISLFLLDMGAPVKFSWTGDGTYPKYIQSPLFNDGILRPALVFRQENDVVQFLSPDVGSVYRVCWIDGAGNRVSNWGDVKVEAGHPDQIAIYNSVVTNATLNATGQHFTMVVL